MKLLLCNYSAHNNSNHCNMFYIGSVRVVGARCSSVVRAFAHGAMGRRIDPSWSGPN